jgi:hypothetical protein
MVDGFFLAFNAMLVVYGSLEAERNDLAHGCFGVCDEDPTILFWIHVKDYVWFQTEVLSKESRGEIAEDRHARLKQRNVCLSSVGLGKSL